ncbi:hypothetical protein [Gluconobacter albidus]|uniref:Uncharacterized protein n=1 Tax=Gluconobacter albidus TaxID=318683 RepID=A0ABQ5X1K2_9PROT|nr:hypothetical protein [Gluconobacter albidus]MBS1029469.1 hypothetical protein [Gluconobacter albidus]GBQ90882.1 hypothetical protein AA3250_2154 [Gluconobacter albidus NBRC 3250]GLQ69378.1 hypothetical protein GCM10007866_18290 [Gluconobacter albidus]
MPEALKSRAGLGATIRQFSTPKTVRKTAFIPAKAEDNSPTPERLEKVDYEWQGKKRIKLNTVNALHMAGDINGDAVTAAKWWICDYVFANHGYLDILSDVLPSDYVKGDVHTFAISRGNAAERIGMIRDRLGLCAHVRLEMMLAKELSFSAMAEALVPDKSAHGRRIVSGQCALILEQLCGAYAGVRKEISDRIERNKALVLGPSA